jgi:diguanylate cyclase (GGDEF)-like protein
MTRVHVSRPSLSLFASLRELYEASRTVRTPSELDAFLERAGALIGDTLGWSTVVINVHRRAWDDFVVTTVHGSDEAREHLMGTTQTWAQWGPLLRDRFERRGAYHIPGSAIDIADSGLVVYEPPRDPDESRPGAWDPQDLLIVPMHAADGEINGILSVDEPVSGLAPSNDDLDALVIVAHAAGAALDQTRDAAQDAEHRAALQQLLEVSTRIADARSANVVLEAVCHGIRDALGFERVTVALPSDDGTALRGVAAAGWDLADPVLQIDLPLETVERLLRPEYEQQGCYVLERRDALRILGVDGFPYTSEHNGSGPWAWYRDWLILPLRDREGDLIGGIWADEPRDRLLPTTPKLQALRLFADQAQAALETARHYEEMLHAAEHDGLTGLPNRRTLLDRLHQALLRARRAERTVAVLFVDLDRFKAINDTYGHDAGDEVLRTVASRIDGLVRPGDTVARLGGDEFVVLCEDIRDEDDALDVARRLRGALAIPIRLENDAVTLTASVGVSLPSWPNDTARALLRDADIAMYRAKQAGRDGEHLASDAMRAGASARIELERALGGAIERDEIELYWQPIVCLQTGRVHRAEGLLRWNHPSIGPVGPLEFIPVAEETGAILDLGRWVLAQACLQAERWQQTHGDLAPGAAVNLSPRQLRDTELTGEVERLLARHHLAPGTVTVEITEGVLLDGGPATAQVIESLQALGVSIELDDFGTGYSSLSSLERFRVDGLKIDRRFVSGRQRDGRGRAVVEALLMMARALGLRATAEGIETEEQLAWLRSLGADFGQGYLFARPAPAAAIDLLVTQPRRFAPAAA